MSTARKISAKPTNVVNLSVVDQKSIENNSENRLSVHITTEADDAETCARPMFCMICAKVVAPMNR